MNIYGLEKRLKGIRRYIKILRTKGYHARFELRKQYRARTKIINMIKDLRLKRNKK